MLRVRNRIKAESVLEKVRQAFDVPIDISVLEPYWKDENLWECWFSVEVTGGSDAEVAFTCLILAHRLGNGWYILGPGGRYTLQVFEGIFDVKQSPSVYIMGVDWASFSLVSSETGPSPQATADLAPPEV